MKDNAQVIDPLTFIIEKLQEIVHEDNKLKRLDLTSEILEALKEL